VLYSDLAEAIKTLSVTMRTMGCLPMTASGDGDFHYVHYISPTRRRLAARNWLELWPDRATLALDSSADLEPCRSRGEEPPITSR